MGFVDNVKMLFKLRAGLKDLVHYKASETYALWGGVLVTLLTHYAPGATETLTGIVQKIGFPSLQEFAGVLFTYAAMRFTSKTAKA